MSHTSRAPAEPYCLRDPEQGKVVGHKPSWAGDQGRRHCWLNPPQSTWAKVLLFPVWAPLWLYKRVVYDGRPDIVSRKTKPADWIALQSEMRFLQAIFFYLGPPSHVLWHIKYPLLLNMAIAVLITINASFEYYNLQPFLPDLDTLVSNSFRLIVFALSLLLAFRINRTYDRWWQARQAFGGVGSAATTLSQQALQWVDDPAIRAEIFRWSKIWHYALLQFCRGDAFIDPKAAALMSSTELQYYHASPKGRHVVVMQLRRLLGLAQLRCEEERTEMERSVQAGAAAAGVCVRLCTQAMPYSVTLMCTGFLEIFLMFLPCGMITVLGKAPAGDNPAFGLIIYFFTCVLMLGMDEVANELEQPFPHLPLEELVQSTVKDIDRVQKEFVVWTELEQDALKRQRGRLSRQQAAAAAAVADSGMSVAGVMEQERGQHLSGQPPLDGIAETQAQ